MYTLLFVDDEQDILDSLQRSFRRDYHTLTAASGAEAIGILNSTEIDLIISDQRMPNISGDQVLKHALEHQPEAIRILLTGYSDMELLVTCVNEAQIYKYLSKPWEPEILRLTVVRALESLELGRQLRHAHQEAIVRLSRAAELRDPETGAHILRMAHYSAHIARRLGLPRQQVELILQAAPMHDIGKVGIPDSILLKPGKLDPEEFETIKKHTSIGHKILKDSASPLLQIAAEIALTHHERFDGTGYPHGLAGEHIPIGGRIIAVADVFDALMSERPYKKPWDIETARTYMHDNAGSHFDPACVRAFLDDWDEILAIKSRYIDES